jgi:hypothetical protein
MANQSVQEVHERNEFVDFENKLANNGIYEGNASRELYTRNGY